MKIEIALFLAAGWLFPLATARAEEALPTEVELPADEETGEPIEDETNPNAQTAGAGTGCYPQCRGGFFCLQGGCISPCNPPCQPGDLCTRGGRCIPEKPKPPLTPSGMTFEQEEQRRKKIARAKREHNRRKHKIFQKKRDVGVALLIPGATMISVGIALGAVYGAEGGEAVLISSLCIGIVGNGLLIPGLISTITGKRGMDKAARLGFELRDIARRGRVQFAGVAPLLSPRDSYQPRGAAFRFTF